jgi:hypothetical protein
MATTTTNFGWDIPQSTDLVKDGATAIAALGQDIDTAMVDLKGGTTGQVLAKASATDLDFSWVAVDPLTILDAKGDLISATAPDTPARLAVGANGTVLTADSAESTGIKWATPTSGGLTLISTTTLSTGTTTISATLTSYKNVFMLVKMAYASATTILRMRINGDTGGNYNTNIIQSNDTSASGRQSINGTSFLIDDISTGSTVRAALNGRINLYRVNDTNEISADWAMRLDDGVSYGANHGVGIYDCSAAVSSITFLLDSGTFTAGTVYLYGVN